MLTDGQLLELNVLEEAGGEIVDGQAAVARVVKNRMALKYSSDGTIAGTVLAKDQFSWAWFGFETVHSGTGVHDQAHQEYVRLSWTVSEALAHATDLYDMAPVTDLARCGQVAQQVMQGSYSSPVYSQLTDDIVLYLNPKILTKLPTWAIPSKLVVRIGHHDFYRA